MSINDNKKARQKYKLKFSVISSAFCAVLFILSIYAIGYAQPSRAMLPGLNIVIPTNPIISDEAASFSISSSDDYDYLFTWDFGDDTFNDITVGTQEIEHKYAYADTYKISVSAVNEEDEQMGTTETYVTVEPPDLAGTWIGTGGKNHNPDVNKRWYLHSELTILTDGSFTVEDKTVYINKPTEGEDKNEDEYYTSYVDPKDIVHKDQYGTYKHISHAVSGLNYDTWEFTIYGGDRVDADKPWTFPSRMNDNTIAFYNGLYIREEPNIKNTPVISQDTSTSSPETTPEPITAKIDVSLSSDYFKEIDEEIIISIKLTDIMGESAIAKNVSLENLDDGSIVIATTDNYGNASFIVKHTLEDNKAYKYKLTSLDISKPINIPVRSANIEVEINPATNKPYTGIMADETNELEINLNFYNMPDGKLSVDIPMGSIKGENETVDIELTNGMAKIIYQTPAYIPADAINGWNEYLSVWNAENILVFKYTTWDDKVFEYEVPIDLYRPPVMLVHGFTGDALTWMALDEWLLTRKYTTIRKEYYAGNNSIPAQSLELHRNLRKEFDRYNINGIKDGKVDVVAHSMGGLITRYYTNHTQFYTGQIRKLIMVGTPNHGCSWADLQLGILGSWLLGKHESAAKQLYQDSPFIQQVNYGENVGAHLNPDMQYAIVYSYSLNPKFFGGDAVVAATSAVLNGVTNFPVKDHVHSRAINDIPFGPKGIPITDDIIIFDKIKTWLNADIFRAALKNTKVELMKIDGNVEIKTWEGANRVDKIIYESVLLDGPYKIDAYDDIITNDSKVIIRVSIDGTTVGYINLDKDSHIRIGNASSRLIDIKMLKGKGRYITFKNGGIHFAVQIETRDGEWQTVTGLDTDFVISLDDETEVLLLEGEAIIAAQSDADEIDQRTIDSDEAIYIDDTGDISRIKVEDIKDKWFEDGFYKIPITTRLKVSTLGLVNKMILKTQSMGYSIYMIVIIVLILLLIILKSRRHKVLLWLFMIAVSALSLFMLYYFASDMQIPIFNRIDNLLSTFKDDVVKIGALAILALIILSGFISMLTGKSRRRGIRNDDYDGYDYFDDDDQDDGDD